MKIFVTGASGFIGSAVTKELLGVGHTVVGLARSDESAQKLTALGAAVQRGTLEELDVLRKAASEADGVIHLAFIHDFANYQASAETDRRAIEAMGEALAGSNKPFVVTNGTSGIAPGRVANENDAASPEARRVSETAALAFVDRGVKVSAIRLPPSVHGETDVHGFVPTLINIAKSKGISGYIGEGTNRWPAVHVLDAAQLFRLAVESAPAGSRLHAVGDEGIPTRQIAEAIGKHLNLPIQSVPADKADEHFGWIGRFFSLDVPASSKITQSSMNWYPTHPGLLEDLEAGFYFNR